MIAAVIAGDEEGAAIAETVTFEGEIWIEDGRVWIEAIALGSSATKVRD
jgi:hypothetical protein